jgi:hypothetical protein
VPPLSHPGLCHALHRDPPHRLPARPIGDIEFVTGRVYRYFAVPEAVAEGFRRVRSKGGYFNRALRDRFAFVRLSGWVEDGNDGEP